MSLIKPISFLQRKRVSGVVPSAPKIPYVLGFNFRNYNAVQVGSAIQGSIAKIGTNGALDTTWSSNANPNPTTQVRFGGPCGNGKIYVDARGSSSTNAILREINPTTGVIERTVNTNSAGGASIWRMTGTSTISDYFFISGEQTMAVQGVTCDGIGKILTSTLLPDTTFATNIGTGPNAFTEQFFITPTKLGICGNFTSFNGNTQYEKFIVLNHDGTRDTTFNRTAVFNGNTVTTLFLDNKWFVGGAFTTYGGVTNNRLVALNANGSVDTTFTTNLGTGFNNTVRGLYRLTDTSFLVVGYFTTLNGVTMNRIAIVNTDGTIVANRFGTGFNQSPSFVAVDADNDVMYLSGERFTSYNGVTTLSNIVALKISDGTIVSTFVTGTGMRSSTNTVSDAGNVFFM